MKYVLVIETSENIHDLQDRINNGKTVVVKAVPEEKEVLKPEPQKVELR